MTIKKNILKNARCVLLLCVATVSNNVMGSAFKMSSTKFLRVVASHYISRNIKRSRNNGLTQRRLCDLVAQEDIYTGKLIAYHTQKRGNEWHRAHQQYRYPLGIQLAIGVGATAGLCFSMERCEAATGDGVFTIVLLAPPLVRRIEELQDAFLDDDLRTVDKIIRKWALKRLSLLDLPRIAVRGARGGFRNVDLGVLLRCAAQEGSYCVCLGLIKYAKRKKHRLSMDFYTFANSYTPLDYATAGGHYYIAKLLLNNGSRSISRRVRKYVRENNAKMNRLLKKYKL